MKHEVVCAVQECKAPCDGCIPIPSPTDKCCPERYECPAPTRSVPTVNVEGINETTTPRSASSESVSSELHPLTEEPKATPSTEVSPSTERIESEGESMSPHPPDEAINVVDVTSEVAHPPDREVEPSSSHSPPPLPLDEKKLEDVLVSSSSTEPPFVVPSSSDSPSSSSEVPPLELAPSDEGKEDAKDTPPVEKVDEGEESNKIPHEAPSSSPPSTSREEGGDRPQHEGGGHDKEPPSSTTTLSPFTSEAPKLKEESQTDSPVRSPIPSSSSGPENILMPGQPRREEDTGLGDDGTGVQQDARRRPASSGNRKTFPSPGVIPGEGICRHGGKVYQNGDEVKSFNPCVEYCMCLNSIVYCDEKVCPLKPLVEGQNCTITREEGECCPSYHCTPITTTTTTTTMTTAATTTIPPSSTTSQPTTTLKPIEETTLSPLSDEKPQDIPFSSSSEIPETQPPIVTTIATDVKGISIEEEVTTKPSIVTEDIPSSSTEKPVEITSEQPAEQEPLASTTISPPSDAVDKIDSIGETTDKEIKDNGTTSPSHDDKIEEVVEITTAATIPHSPPESPSTTSQPQELGESPTTQTAISPSLPPAAEESFISTEGEKLHDSPSSSTTKISEEPSTTIASTDIKKIPTDEISDEVGTHVSIIDDVPLSSSTNKPVETPPEKAEEPASPTTAPPLPVEADIDVVTTEEIRRAEASEISPTTERPSSSTEYPPHSSTVPSLPFSSEEPSSPPPESPTTHEEEEERNEIPLSEKEKDEGHEEKEATTLADILDGNDIPSIDRSSTKPSEPSSSKIPTTSPPEISPSSPVPTITPHVEEEEATSLPSQAAQDQSSSTTTTSAPSPTTPQPTTTIKLDEKITTSSPESGEKPHDIPSSSISDVPETESVITTAIPTEVKGILVEEEVTTKSSITIEDIPSSSTEKPVEVSSEEEQPKTPTTTPSSDKVESIDEIPETEIKDIPSPSSSTSSPPSHDDKIEEVSEATTLAAISHSPPEQSSSSPQPAEELPTTAQPGELEEPSSTQATLSSSSPPPSPSIEEEPPASEEEKSHDISDASPTTIPPTIQEEVEKISTEEVATHGSIIIDEVITSSSTSLPPSSSQPSPALEEHLPPTTPQPEQPELGESQTTQAAISSSTPPTTTVATSSNEPILVGEQDKKPSHDSPSSATEAIESQPTTAFPSPPASEKSTEVHSVIYEEETTQSEIVRDVPSSPSPIPSSSEKVELSSEKSTEPTTFPSQVDNIPEDIRRVGIEISPTTQLPEVQPSSTTELPSSPSSIQTTTSSLPPSSEEPLPSEKPVPSSSEEPLLPSSEKPEPFSTGEPQLPSSTLPPSPTTHEEEERNNIPSSETEKDERDKSESEYKEVTTQIHIHDEEEIPSSSPSPPEGEKSPFPTTIQESLSSTSDFQSSETTSTSTTPSPPTTITAITSSSPPIFPVGEERKVDELPIEPIEEASSQSPSAPTPQDQPTTQPPVLQDQSTPTSSQTIPPQIRLEENDITLNGTDFILKDIIPSPPPTESSATFVPPSESPSTEGPEKRSEESNPTTTPISTTIFHLSTIISRWFNESSTTTPEPTTPPSISTVSSAALTTTTTTTLPPSTESEQFDEEEHEDGSCIFEGKAFQSAEQIPRPHPCDFCFCFRGDIICLQQTCPPPIPRCYETPIQGFCCPRYECPVSSSNSNTTTPRSVGEPKGCNVGGSFYRVGETIQPASGPCLECKCDHSGLVQCNPQNCSPQPPLLLRMNRDFFASAAKKRR